MEVMWEKSSPGVVVEPTHVKLDHFLQVGTKNPKIFEVSPPSFDSLPNGRCTASQPHPS